MIQKTLFEQMGGTYSQLGEIRLPDLTVEEIEPIGKYGRMQIRYLLEHRPILFSELILSGKLYQPSLKSTALVMSTWSLSSGK